MPISDLFISLSIYYHSIHNSAMIIKCLILLVNDIKNYLNYAIIFIKTKNINLNTDKSYLNELKLTIYLFFLTYLYAQT